MSFLVISKANCILSVTSSWQKFRRSGEAFEQTFIPEQVYFRRVQLTPPRSDFAVEHLGRIALSILDLFRIWSVAAKFLVVSTCKTVPVYGVVKRHRMGDGQH